jgi:ComF family protein
VVSRLLHRLKYNADTTVLPAVTKIIQPFVVSLDLQPDHILPVPLYSSRLKDRGLNQALCLARLFFPGLEQSITASLLLRQRPTRPQTGLDGAARRRNLYGAFRVPDADLIRGKSLCVVDDVYTTGTTVTECCTVLKAAGAIDIKVITLARVVVGA